ncbi:apolipoprotein N-acyltransferase [Oceanibaculum indicum]|uniref:Apolipoprotein N-acyltransferase n=1 Tax=Oceanibaculum indicum P24 TaxID=1207063 RepID=K2J5M1_9PROT|nr:apolipoprotein N-acyltransferase [Oceanibaculum indicum]EKE78366.1 apolipoprotein N-acyltransferase [Oceanibaculum indicum P24]
MNLSGLPAFLDRLAARSAALTGWRRYGLAVLLGAGAALALPPFHILPLLWVAFPVLLWQIEGCATRRQAFALGWCFGLGFFVAGLYWIANALTVDTARFWWLMPLAAVGLPALLAFFTALVVLAVHLLRLRGLALVLGFALFWLIAEYLRGHILTGFPWNLLGYAWAPSGAMLQLAALTGIYGLSFVTVLAACLPAARSRGAMAAAVALLVLVWGGGAVRLAGAPAADDPAMRVEGVVLRLVQATIPQYEKWAGLNPREHLIRHLELSARPAPGPRPTHVLWPETAVPYLLSEDIQARAVVGRVAPDGGAVLTGAVRVERPAGELPRYWNSLHAVGPGGLIQATYDKAHLVPFGEYVPMRDIFGFLPAVATSLDFQRGPGPRSIQVPGLPPVSPLICYEAIFPGAVADPDDRPGWLLNVTNDGWYGFSTGPFQHFQIARLRAIEEGLPLVRVANTGISGVVDSYGRVTARLGLEETGFLDVALPTALPPTPYARWGDAPLAGLVLLLAGLLAVRLRVGRNIRLRKTFD